MKRLFAAIYARHVAFRALHPKMPPLSAQVRQLWTLVMMFGGFTVAYQNPNSKFLYAGMLMGMLSFLTVISVTFDGWEPGKDDNSTGRL